jgi:hypothetical protein
MSEYFGVCKVKHKSSKWADKGWQGSVKNHKTGRMAFRYFSTEKEAAKWVDVQLAKQGLPPVNILVSKGVRAKNTGEEDQGA